MAYNSTFKLQLSTAKLSTNQNVDSLITIITTLLLCLTNSYLMWSTMSALWQGKHNINVIIHLSLLIQSDCKSFIYSAHLNQYLAHCFLIFHGFKPLNGKWHHLYSSFLYSALQALEPITRSHIHTPMFTDTRYNDGYCVLLKNTIISQWHHSRE